MLMSTQATRAGRRTQLSRQAGGPAGDLEEAELQGPKARERVTGAVDHRVRIDKPSLG
jgi:hypothetical protein